jgi:signal transduction histidine kinase/CheY-like chemotaxis protein
MTFGWGWLSFYEHLSPEIQMGFLFTNIVMLFGGLYAYSPHLPAYAAFSVFSLGPALWQVQQNTTIWLAQTVGITLVAFVSQMFAYRWAQNFRHNVLLQEKNAKLLGELTKKKDLAEKATRAKSRFLASVSHDLRQPLHAINLYLAVLNRALEKAQPDTTHPSESLVASSVDHLQDSATQLTRMFEALIDISKLDAGTTQANLDPIKISSMVNQLLQEYSQLAAQRDLIFDKQLPENIDTIEVFADAIMLERVLRNLLANAINHTHKGGVRLRLRVVKRLENVRLEFRVVDTGPGIQQAERAKIFEEFYQSESTRESAQTSHNAVRNLGLGLAISSRLAELLKTEIRLHSYLGKGSAFSFELPMQHTSILDTEQLQSNDANTAMTACLGHACIAVIDDDPHILDATSKLLESYGAIVFTSEDSAQTWQLIRELGKVPDIFLVDHQLVKESGLTLIQAIREKFGPSKPCILVTGDTSADQVANFHQAGVTVLYKPLTDATLIEAISKELGCK